MSETPKLNQSRIFTIGLVLLLLSFGVMMGNTQGGGGLTPDCTNNVPRNLQCGTTSVTISAGTTTAFTAVTFSVPFDKKPNVTATALGPTPPGIFASGFTFQAPGAGVQTWTAMPAAETYIYSPASAILGCCTIVVPGAGISGLSCSFTADVLTGSTSVTAKLIVRFGTTRSGPWTDVGSLPITVNGVLTATITFPTITDSVDYISVWGQNGNGVGDNPQFFAITLGCTLSNQAWGVLVAGITTTGFQVQVQDNAPASFTNSVTIQWIAVNG